MPRPKGVPAYRRHKARGLAKVRIDGKDIYLGQYGTPESRAKYERIVVELLAARSTSTPTRASGRPVSVNDVIAAFAAHAHAYYKAKDGTATDEVKNLRDALRPVRRLYGSAAAVDFGPLALQAVRQQMIDSGLARTTINARVHRIRRCFRWAASKELVAVSVVHALNTVAALAKGRSAAPEPPKVLPVAADLVEATLPFLPAPVAAMVQLQLLTGMRAGEVMVMRSCDVKVADGVWEYRPADHKGEWRDQDRIILLGPKAQTLVRAFLKPDLSAYLFDPRDAVASHHTSRAEGRRSKRTPSERKKLKATPGEARCPRYDRRTYRQAIVRACDKAFPHPTLAVVPARRRMPEQHVELRRWRKDHRWSPLRLRHAAGTAIRMIYGLEAAQVVLGHARADVTQVYAERDFKKAREVMREIG
jgi:integrase